jgi:hypothetical protein
MSDGTGNLPVLTLGMVRHVMVFTKNQLAG